jgi:GNAT superfamily N-acetyltransferase
MQLTRTDPSRRGAVRRFVDLPFALYRETAQWCPPLRRDVALALDRERHPFYRHSDAAFFLAEDSGRALGRIAVMENRNFNAIRGRRDAFFYFFESGDDPRVAAALIDAAADWARDRGLDTLVGPKGLLPGDGLGILVEGFEHPVAMGVPYHHPYYDRLLTACGLEKETDWLSGRLTRSDALPREFLDAADAAAAQSGYYLHPFTSKRELRRWFPRIGEAYNKAFAGNWEFCPLTAEEMQMIGDRLLVLADPRMMVLAMKDDEIVGHLFIVPDLADGLRATGGRLLPFGWARLLLEARRTKGVDWFGMGLLPEHRGVGANAVIYAGIFRAIDQFPYAHADLIQIEEGNTRMLANMTAIGVPWRHRHRIYRMAL